MFFNFFSVFALVIGIIFLQVTDTGIEACQNRMGVLFFLAVNIMFSSQEVGMLFSKERTLYVRELSSGYYTTFPYYASLQCVHKVRISDD